MTDIRFTAKTYIDAGWAVVPLVRGEKRASTRWRSQVYAPSDFKPDDGIAGKCGEPSGWRIDVDLDAPEAIEAAKRLLPETGLIHGRPGKPDSHYWYVCPNIKSMVWSDAKDSGGKAGTLVEIRSTGGYTALPPSGHPSGDTLSWTFERDALTLEESFLVESVRNVAVATLLARHWPGAGARHHAVGHLAGFLCRYGMDARIIPIVVEVAATVAKDPDVTDRLKYVHNTIAKWQSDNDVALTGGPKLAEAFGDGVVARLRSWLGVKDEDAIDEMNKIHFLTRLGKDTVIGREDDPSGVVFQRPRELYPEYANQLVKTGEKVNKKSGETTEVFKSKFEAWLQHEARRSYRSVVFSPPPVPADPQDYNLWKGFAIEPKKGPCPLFLAHLHEIICGGDDEHYAYLLNLLALTFQEPGTPSEVAVVMRGEPGTGKGTLVRALGRIVGRRHFAHLDRVKDLVDFNALISGKLIVFADEAFWAGDKREVGALKRIITEPTIRVTRKGIDSHEERNCIHLFMATNEDWSVPAQLKERRFLALEVSSARRRDHAHFNAIEQELQGGGLAAFLYQCLNTPVDRDMVRNVPATRELRVQQTQTLSLEMQWWLECLHDGAIGPIVWSEFIPAASVYDAYKLWVRDHTHRFLNKIEFGRRLSHYMSVEKAKTRRVNGEVVRCITLRPLAEARKVFDAGLGSSTDWPDPLDPPKNGDIPF